MKSKLNEIKQKHELGTLDRSDIDWLIEQAGNVERMAWALNILKGRTAAYPDFEQFNFIAKQGLGEENSPYKQVNVAVLQDVKKNDLDIRDEGALSMKEQDALELEKQLLKMWAEHGIEEVYKYKHRVKWFRNREGLTHIELFTDLTNGLVFADVKDVANYSDAYPEDCRTSVESLMSARNITR